jgi:tetratricopeptide (TPR) repeat protein
MQSSALEQGRSHWGERARLNHRLELGPLDEASTAELGRRLLQPVEHVPAAVLDFLYQRTRGIPLALLALIRGLRRANFVQERPEGTGFYLATELLESLPDMPTIEWLASQELEALPRDVESYARLAAALAEFDVDEFLGVLEELDRGGQASEYRLDGRVALAQMQRAELLIAHRDGSYGFSHTLVRDAIVEGAPKAALDAIHRAACGYYRKQSTTSNTRRRRLAHHAAASGERGEAAAIYLSLAHGARDRHAYLEAELLYTNALNQLDEGDTTTKLSVYRGRGIARYRIARYDDALADLLAARELAKALAERTLEIDIVLDAAMALDWMGEARRSKDLVAEVAPLVATTSHRLLEARLLQAQGRSASRFNQDRESIEHFLRAIEICETLGEEAYEILVTSLMHLGFVLPFVGRVSEAERCLNHALELCQAHGDELHLGGVFNNRACLWIACNQRERALEDLKQARHYAVRLGIIDLERHVEQNLGTYLYWLGQLDVAEAHIRRMIDLDAKWLRQGKRPEGTVLLSRLLWARGDTTGCQELVTELTRHQEEARKAGRSEALLLPNDQVLLDAVHLALEDAQAQDWSAVLERSREHSQGQEVIEVLDIRAEAAYRNGDIQSARESWEVALELGERIPNVLEQRIRDRVESLS